MATRMLIPSMYIIGWSEKWFLFQNHLSHDFFVAMGPYKSENANLGFLKFGIDSILHLFYHHVVTTRTPMGSNINFIPQS